MLTIWKRNNLQVALQTYQATLFFAIIIMGFHKKINNKLVKFRYTKAKFINFQLCFQKYISIFIRQFDIVYKHFLDFNYQIQTLFKYKMALTQQRAQKRFKCLKQGSIFYDFHISLQIGNQYNGLSQIAFDLNFIPDELSLDFKGTNVKALNVNGENVELKTQDGFIVLDVTKLKLHDNNIAVFYRNKYDNDGSGCVSFTDVDGKQYLYTQFQSYFANRVFALFDQPDLKAKMRLNIISPKQWKKILSNQYPFLQSNFNQQQYQNSIKTKSSQTVKVFLQNINSQNSKMTLFPETKLLPTYLYCFIGGQYEQLKLQNPYNGIPMSLYCIQSLYKYMKEMAPFIFEITIESLKFFEQFFGYKYSFNKYDQVFAHQYKWGAMENAGIVTHNDRYIYKDAVSTQTKLDFANTIAHQLAHHWFGNLVTMKWWDDLWLNESFADYISYFCLQKIKDKCKTIKYQSAMASFLSRKGWGYHQDQMITTHPIRGPVPNTSVADSIFDGITYSKGASTMKQLNFLMSQQKFSAALKQYFHKFEWKNATLDDFMAVMSNHFTSEQFTLQKWRQLWLQNACCNKIQAHWNINDKCQKAKIQIKQTHVLQQHPTLRMHRIKIGLIKQNGQIDAIQTLIQAKQINEAYYNGSSNYKAILLNYEDHSFVKIVIDKTSLEYFSNNLSSIKDLVSRTLIWKSFYDMVKDGELKSNQYLKIVVKFLPTEQSDSIFENQLDYLYNSINTYTPLKMRDEMNHQVFLFILNILTKQSEKFDQNRIVILKEKLLRYAQTTSSKQIILSWFKDQHQELKKHEMTLNLRWKAVVKAFTLSQLSSQQKWQLFDKQQQSDPSDDAKNNKHLCKTLICSKQQFDKLYNQFKDKQSELSITVKQYLASGWNHKVHQQKLLEYREKYFSDILALSNVLEGDHFSFFYKNLQPIDDDLQYHITKYEQIKLQPGKLDKHIRDLQKIVDQLRRRLRAYKLFQQQ